MYIGKIVLNFGTVIFLIMTQMSIEIPLGSIFGQLFFKIWQTYYIYYDSNLLFYALWLSYFIDIHV